MGGHPTELPGGNYDLAVFENRFPSLTLDAPTPPNPLERAGVGKCEVVVFSQNADGRLADLSGAQMELLLQVWADRTTRLAATGKIHSVLAFENRGVEVGVTLHHPHGQIYAYDHMPPVDARMLATPGRTSPNRAGVAGRFCGGGASGGRRVVHDGGEALSIVPPFARYTYETWIMPTRPVGLLSDLTAPERAALRGFSKMPCCASTPCSACGCPTCSPCTRLRSTRRTPIFRCTSRCTLTCVRRAA